MSLADLARRDAGTVPIDEPPPPDIWGELCARVLRQRGRIRLTMTPIGRPVEWLRELVERGEVADLHEQAEEAGDAGESWLRAAAYAVSRGEHRRKKE